MATFKLKNTETGLYWKGGEDFPFDIPEDLASHCSRIFWRGYQVNKSYNKQWNKVGKAWATEATIKSAITGCVKRYKTYLRITDTIYVYDYCLYDYLIEQFTKHTVVEKFTNPEEIKFNNFYEVEK